MMLKICAMQSLYELLWSTDWRYWKQIKNYLWFIFCKRPSLNSLNTPLKRCNIDCWLLKELLTLKCISKCETCPLFHSPGCTIQLQHHFVKCHIYLWCISICLRHITYLWYLYICLFEIPGWGAPWNQELFEQWIWETRWYCRARKIPQKRQTQIQWWTWNKICLQNFRHLKKF